MKIPRFDNANILTVGDAMLDRYWHGDTRRVSAEAPIPVVDISDIEDRPGGAANVALNVATLGAASSLVAATGQDEMGEVLRSKLESSGIACRFLLLPDWSTITKIRLVSRNQQMLRADFEQPANVSVENLVAAIKEVSGYDAVILSDYDKGLFANPEKVIAELNELGKPILVDPKFRSFSDYRGATVIKPNTLELHNAIGHWDSDAEMIAKCRALMENINCEALLVTRASEG